MMEEPYLMDLIKDQLCFVSTDVQADLRAAQVWVGRGAEGAAQLSVCVCVGGGGGRRAA